jgi:hypothetical protein
MRKSRNLRPDNSSLYHGIPGELGDFFAGFPYWLVTFRRFLREVGPMS